MRMPAGVLCACVIVLAFGMGCGTPARAAIATTFDVFINTTAISGAAGLVDLQLNPGSATAPAATAWLSNVSGPAFGSNPLQVDGNVTGALPGNTVFDNGTAFNALLQEVPVFFQGLGFRVEFGGSFLSALSGDGTTFSLALLAPDLSVIPTFNTDLAGRMLTFELSPGSIAFSAFDPAVSIAPVIAVPEPQTNVLLLLGLMVLAVRWLRTVRNS